MTGLAQLKGCTGSWSGSNKLWLDPTKPARQSDQSATVATAGQGRFVTITYTWADDGKPQDGLMIVGFEKDRNMATVSWLDSWHMGAKVMKLEGPAGTGPITVRGTYPAPPGPDWGWTIQIEPAADRLRIVMHNISPDGQASMAVDTVLTRA